MKIKKPARYYGQSTAKWAKRTGDAVLSLGTTITVIAAADGWEKNGIIISALLTWLGKTLLNFVAEDNPPTPYQPDNVDIA